MQNYEYAVMDGNRGHHDYEQPVSCHRTRAAAVSAAKRLNTDPNDHYIAVEWGGKKHQRQQLAACIRA